MDTSRASRGHRTRFQCRAYALGRRCIALLALGLAVRLLLLMSPAGRQVSIFFERGANAADFIDKFDASPDESWTLDPSWQVSGDGYLRYSRTGAAFHDTAACTDKSALARRPGCAYEVRMQWETDSARACWLELRFYSTNPGSDPDSDNHFLGLRTGYDEYGRPVTECFDGANWRKMSWAVFGRGTPADFKLVLHWFFLEVSVNGQDARFFPLRHDWSYLEPQIAARVPGSAAFSVEVDEVKVWTPMSYRLLDLEGLARLPEPWERCRLESSYDRHSRWSDPAFQWGANADGSSGGIEYIPNTEDAWILGELDQAPAVVWRIWSALPHNSPFRIAVDGQERSDVSFRDYFLLNGEEYPALSYRSTPTSGTSVFRHPWNPVNVNYGNGHNSYLPIPYKYHALFPVDKYHPGHKGDFLWVSIGSYWHITYSEFPERLRDIIPSYDTEQVATKVADSLLREPFLGDDPAGDRNDGWWKGQPVSVSNQLTVPAGSTEEVANISGTPDGRAITAIKFRLKQGSNALTNSYERARALRELVLAIHWDGEEHPSVWVPVGDFFGTAMGLHPYGSLPMGMKLNDGKSFDPVLPSNSDFYYYGYWYMPFSAAALVTLENTGSVSRDVDVTITHAELSGDAGDYTRFHARWHRVIQDDTPTPYPWPDRQLLDLTEGKGRYVGTMMHVYKPSADNDPLDPAHWFATAWWGEGDEKFFVDDDFTQPEGPFPSIFGTGTEDYFGYAWGQSDLFHKAFHGQVLNQAGNLAGHNYGHISLYRWHIADNIPFQEQIEARLEKYFRDSYVRYAVIPYFYLDEDHSDPYQSPDWTPPSLADYYPPLDDPPPWATGRWATFIGAGDHLHSDDDAAVDVLFDSEEKGIVVVGHTSGIDAEPPLSGAFPVDRYYGTSGAGGKDNDVYVVKFDEDGSRLWTTCLLGSDEDKPTAASIDGTGNIYVTGITDSGDFPAAAERPVVPGSEVASFLAKLDPQGKLIWAIRIFRISDPLGEYASDVAFDTATGYVYVTGERHVPGPTLPSTDAFVVRYDSSGGSRLEARLGGSADDSAYGVSAYDGTVYVVGVTESADFPVQNAFDTTLGGSSDAFVARLNASLDVVWATFLGGNGVDGAHKAEVYKAATSNDVFVVGYTASQDFPGTQLGYRQFYMGGERDAFIARLQGDPCQLLWSSYHGGSENDVGNNVTVDEANDEVYIAGSTNVNAWVDQFLFYPVETDDSNGGIQDAFVARINPDGSGFSWSSLLGGTGLEKNNGLALDDSGHVLLCGWTTSDNFINYIGAWDQTFDGSSSGYLTKMVPPPAGN